MISVWNMTTNVGYFATFRGRLQQLHDCLYSNETKTVKPRNFKYCDAMHLMILPPRQFITVLPGHNGAKAIRNSDVLDDIHDFNIKETIGGAISLTNCAGRNYSILRHPR